MEQYNQLCLIDCVEIHNNPYLGYQFNVKIEKSGVIWYSNNTDCPDGSMFLIRAEDAERLIGFAFEHACYDSDKCGVPMIDGYHWEILFYRKNELIDRIEGWPNEDQQRYRRFKNIIEFAERYIPKDLGAGYMTYARSV